MGTAAALDVGRLAVGEAVIDAGVSMTKVLDRSYLDLDTTMGRGFTAMMSAIAEDERLRIIDAPHAKSRTVGASEGVRMGAQAPKLTRTR